MTETHLSEEQLEALRVIVAKVRKIFNDLMQSLRDALKTLLVHIRIIWRHYQFCIQPDRRVYEWWLINAARRQLVFAE